MPTFRITAPDGKTYEVKGPEGSTADQALERVRAQVGGRSAKAPTPEEKFDPTEGMGTSEKVLAGIGKGMTDLARGAGQWVGAVSRKDIEDARALDAPLMGTTAGRVGEFIGKAVPIAASSVLVPGAASLGGAAGIGAVSGAIEPSTSSGETLRNIGMGAVSGAASQKIGNVIADKLANRSANSLQKFTAGQTANAQRLQAARDAAAKGFVVPPSDIQPQNALVEALGGFSGKIKTAQVASAQNQKGVDALAKKAVGLQADDPITRDVLDGIRKNAGAAYDQFRNIGPIQADATYNTALDAVEQQMKGAARSFPGLKSGDVDKLVSTMRQPSFDAGDAIDATKVLRGLSDDAFASGNKTLAKAYRQVSDAVEGAMERQLQAVAPDAVNEFRAARQLIAKTYTVEKVLNGQTGQVSAQKLAQRLKSGKPLSGELREIAEFAEAFPKAAQSLAEAPKAISPLDWALALMGGAGTGNAAALASIGARPAVRAGLLSGPMQRLAMASRSAPSTQMADLAGNPLARLLYGPVGAVGGVAAVNSK